MICKRKIVSLFSGGGGLDLGFLRAGFEIVWAIDNDKNAVSTYIENIGNHIICADINSVDVSLIPKCDIVIGGPPCQSFSLAGNRKSDDDRGNLVWKYLEIINSVQPAAFLFENVQGLTSAKNKNGDHILPQLESAFKEIGYSLKVQVLNSADFGVPQIRKRVIIVGLKGNFEFCFPPPTHTTHNYISVLEALDDLPPASNDEKSELAYIKQPETHYQKMMRLNSDFVSDHIIPTMSELDKYIISFVKPGGNYMDIPADVPSERIKRLQREGGHTTCYGRMIEDKPSYTINTYFNRPNVGCNIHYKENRLITVREALRLQGFPDSYKLVSTSKQGKNLIVGNAVPPILSEILAKQLLKTLVESEKKLCGLHTTRQK